LVHHIKRVKPHLLDILDLLPIPLLMHPKLAIADHTQKHHCPFLFPITKLYTVHSHHLTILADAFEYLLLVAKCESWSVKALIYLVLIAHVEDVLHYVGRFNLGSAV
jgi:hypothetical protein